MGSIADGMAYVLEQARLEQEKVASSAKNDDPALDMQITHAAPLSSALKTAAQHLSSMRTDVSVNDIHHLIESLSNGHS